MRRYVKYLIIFACVILVLLLYANYSVTPGISYGVSFSVYHSNELDLNWKQTFNAIVDELKVRKFRLSAHWPQVEPRDNNYDFSALDYQIKRIEALGGSVVLAVGRRLPGWPECHVPDWAVSLDAGKRREALLQYMRIVVDRYKDSPAIKYWQVENEPFLGVFATEFCGGAIDEADLKEEIALVREIDSDTPVLITDSGEISTWRKPYKYGDAFGTSVYVYIWNHRVGEFKYPIPAVFFDIKRWIWEIWYGKKPSMLIELSTEPWLLTPIKDASIQTQLSRMGIDKMKEVVSFSSRMGFKEQYLWGAEWWYWLKEHGYSEHWEYAKRIFNAELKSSEIR